MEMRLDRSLIRKEREKRAWSQERLAEVAGIGLRTVQRIEATGAASYESAGAIAAALDMPVTDLIERRSAASRARTRRFVATGVMASIVTVLCIVVLLPGTSIGHDDEPRITLNVQDVPFLSLRETLWRQTNDHVLPLHLVIRRGLENTNVSFTGDNVPIGDVFLHFRKDFGVCAYRTTSRAPMLTLIVRLCSEPSTECKSGMASPYPHPSIRYASDGRRLKPKIGAFLCGGAELQQMLDDDTTHVPVANA